MNASTTLPIGSPQSCPECGRVMVSTSPQGLCPHCLLVAATDFAPDTVESSPDTPLPLRRLGNYEILDVLAQGGMGVVYRARHVQLRRTVALKMITAGRFASAAEVARFRIEAEAAARLEHPNIVPIFEIGEEAGCHYFTMKLVEGGSLGAAIQGHRFPLRHAAQLLAKVAHAAHFAHERGVLHRDLKPNNILLDEHGQPVLTDFGLAKLAENRADLTQSLAVMGSVHYMAPEQAQGESRQLTTSADVYSLGAVLYEMLVGHPPFQGDNVVDVLRQVIETPPPPPSRLNPEIDRDLETICLKCLEKQPGHRYASAEFLALDLERWLQHEPVHARPASPSERLVKWARRKPTSATLALVSIASIAVLTGLMVRHSRQLDLRIHSLLHEQARAERALGHRQNALNFLGEAAAMKPDADLRDEAIQTLSEPGLRLAFEIPFGSIATTGFSPDGRAFAAGGDVPMWRGTQVVTESSVRIWSVPSGEPLAHLAWKLEEGPFAFSPDSRTLAVPQPDQRLALCEVETGRVQDRLDAVGAPMFSPDGRHLVLATEDSVRVFRLSDRREIAHRKGNFANRGFVAPDLLLLHAWPRRLDGELRVWNFLDGLDRPLDGSRVSPIASANGQIMGILPLTATNSTSEIVFSDILKGTELARLKPPEHESTGMLSPNGRHIAFASPHEPGRFLLWEVLGSRFLAGVGEPGCVAMSAFCGFRRLAGSITTQESNTPRPESRWPSPASSFSPDGSLFACESRQGERNLMAWDVGSGRRLGIVPSAGRPVWSADGRWLAVQHDGNVVLRSTNLLHQISGRVVLQVWSVSRGIPVRHLPGPVRSMAFSSDGHHLAAEDQHWRIDASATGIQLEPSEPLGVRGVLRFAGNHLWDVDAPPFRSAAQFRFREVSPPAQIFEPLELGAALAFAFSPDGQSILLAATGRRNLSGAGDEAAKPHYELWDLTRRERRTLWTHPSLSTARNDKLGIIAFSADGSLVASSCFSDEGLEIWDARTGQLLRSLRPRPSQSGRTILGVKVDRVHDSLSNSQEREALVNHIVFTPDRRHVLYACLDQTLLRNVDTGEIVHRRSHPKQPVLGFALSPDGTLLATGGEDRRITLWHLETGREITHWEAHASAIESLAFHPDHPWLASGSREGILKLWDLPAMRRDLTQLGLDW
ncbi:MAG: protein kinase [Verrucomicrobiales bacterium]|nr:protein kinase [Verrucomicrobiales bacterium]